MPFSVHINLDDLARGELAAALDQSSPETPAPGAGDIAHHGAGDARQAARERSGRDRSGRAAGAAGGRSYAFRRS
ncbi:hypothetical protein FB565_003817 [Actinoplanes lutulentus]|uniref:Uncharacterized protein n=1 Tax=Actinoplanes lutulentus TaxID=1287878 RepID=A0A327ZJ44_9ACTN|nr:hypothetical protein [Actinoplanes lutulentus]MBB2944088.1 hypothetical protein [Actinoplanes lutulentus]RAK42679.1 hypothetical protein B0I29_102504 [Actinoplanes lutulentus]